MAAVASSDLERARNVAHSIDTAARPASVAELPLIASRILIATSDARIEAVAEAMASAPCADLIVLHTCGAAGPDALTALRRRGVPVGVFHPLQTVPGGEVAEHVFDGVAFAVAGDPRARDWATELAACLRGRTITIRDDAFAAYHAGAVLASNGIAALVDAAVSLLARGGVDRGTALDALAPLTHAAVDNVFRLGPAAALTGPVVRGDVTTVARHLTALGQGSSEVVELYRAVARCLIRLAAERGQAPEVQAALTRSVDTRKEN